MFIFFVLRYIGNYWKHVFKLVFSFLLGVSDYGLDIVVLVQWFQEGEYWWASLMLFFIIIYGFYIAHLGAVAHTMCPVGLRSFTRSASGESRF